jgi:hypothetical protein
MRPAAPSNLVRETPPEGMEIAGHFVPGNVSSEIAEVLTVRLR